ncbi:hypothetical protein DVS28_a0065 [Euzebya pacifica]|uniref:Uncharacterized protein n=1 Tax=Euzebya pacifica TaxID=1608957 RepID=A0A346XRC6_9ACTN|nr:molecular chaperone TorD family protein [Euzebya pacifica]AXV04773.1 hypothetical protein DVS28_a0065 [Euzebya pacifica]
MELLRALGTLAEQPDVHTADLARLVGLDPPTPDEWHATFVERFYPYASVHLGQQGFLGGPVRDGVAGVLDTIGARVAQEADHLAVLLDAFAHVDERGWVPGRAVLLWEHILPWTLPFLDRVALEGAGPFRDWAQLLSAVLADTAERVPRPSGAELVLVEEPDGLPDPRLGGEDDLVQALLAPARYGAILTRDDLLLAAGRLDLAPRVGERRYVLRALLQQDPAGTLGWLGNHARAADYRTRTWPEVVGHLAAWWSSRATRSADLLNDLADDARTAKAVA